MSEAWAELEAVLTPVLRNSDEIPDLDGVCSQCFGHVPYPGSSCRTCFEAASHYGYAYRVAPMALAVKHEQLATSLWQYKDHPDPRVRQAAARRLVLLMSCWLPEHLRCLALEAGVHRFDLVTWVPSSPGARDGEQPLRMLLGQVPVFEGLLTEALVNHGGPKHVLVPDRISAQESVAGRRILVIDDTFTTGFSIRAAVHALRLAGAAAVGAVVIGRHFDRYYGSAGQYYAAASPRPYDLETCAVEYELPW